MSEPFSVEVLEGYLRGIGYRVQVIHDSAATAFTSVSNVEVPAGYSRKDL